MPSDVLTANAIVATAHAALDAAVISQWTGVPQMVVFGEPLQAVH